MKKGFMKKFAAVSMAVMTTVAMAGLRAAVRRAVTAPLNS